MFCFSPGIKNLCLIFSWKHFWGGQGRGKISSQVENQIYFALFCVHHSHSTPVWTESRLLELKCEVEARKDFFFPNMIMKKGL